MRVRVEDIESKLAQTQCKACGYEGCLPYANAIAMGKASITLCKPGGTAVVKSLADLLGVHPVPEPAFELPKPLLAFIDAQTCIGCTLCVAACPTGAIDGVIKQAHVVEPEPCTGCGLCLPPCPVDCITLIPTDQPQKSAAEIRLRVLAVKKQRAEKVRKKSASPDLLPPDIQATIAAARARTQAKYAGALLPTPQALRDRSTRLKRK